MFLLLEVRHHTVQKTRDADHLEHRGVGGAAAGAGGLTTLIPRRDRPVVVDGKNDGDIRLVPTFSTGTWQMRLLT